MGPVVATWAIVLLFWPVIDKAFGSVPVAAAIRNVMLAAMAANTTNNAIAGSAVPTDCTASTMRTNNGTLRPCLPQRA